MLSDYRFRLLAWTVIVPNEITNLSKIVQRFRYRSDAESYAKFLNQRLNQKAEVVFYSSENHGNHQL